MGQGSNKAMGKSSIFSGSGSKQGLAAKIQKFNPSASQDMILSGQGPAKPTKKAGFNFSPVEGGKRGVSPDGQKLQRGQRGLTLDLGANNLGKDGASNFYDADQDGDSIGNDYNQDGTMLGRGIKAAKKFFGGPGLIDPPKTKKKLKSVTGQQKRVDALSQKDKDMIANLRQKRKEQNANNKKMQNSYITSSGPGKTDPKDGVVVSGDKDKVNNKVTKTNTKAKKLALLKEKKAILKAKALEKVNEKKNLNQVKRDKLKNQKLQKKREIEGKDYQANTGEDDQKTVRRS